MTLIDFAVTIVFDNPNKVYAVNRTIVAAETSAAVAQALAHPTRLRILHLLRGEEAYVMHLTCLLARPQANISQHLAVLRDAGLVIGRRDGTSVLYRVRDERVFGILEALGSLAGSSPEAWQTVGRGRLSGAAEQRGQNGPCRCPHCRERWPPPE